MERQVEKWDSGTSLICLANCWPLASHWTTPYFSIRKRTCREWEQLLCRPQSWGISKEMRATKGVRKAEGPRVQAAAMTSSSRGDILITHELILFPHSIVLPSPQDQPLIGIPRIIWGTGNTTHQWRTLAAFTPATLWLGSCLSYSSAKKHLQSSI